jgi:hypothetical protein
VPDLCTSGRTASLLVLSLCGGCSSTSAAETPDAAERDGARSDAEPVDDATASDGDADAIVADAGPDVWRTDSTGFELSVSGGLPNASGASDCSGNAYTWQYDAPSRVLARTGCAGGVRVAAAVALTLASDDELEARLSELKSTGPRDGACGADAPDIVLTVLGPASSRRSYDSDFYSGCQGFDAGGLLFVRDSDLELLQQDLFGFVAACRGDGGVTDAGASCVNAAGDAGPDGASP